MACALCGQSWIELLPSPTARRGQEVGQYSSSPWHSHTTGQKSDNGLIGKYEPCAWQGLLPFTCDRSKPASNEDDGMFGLGEDDDDDD